MRFMKMKMRISSEIIVRGLEVRTQLEEIRSKAKEELKCQS